MGHVYANITLLNSFEVIAVKKGFIAEEDVKKLTVDAMIDSGAMTLTLSLKNLLSTRTDRFMPE